MRTSVADVVERCGAFVRTLVRERYGVAPPIRVSGHVGARFPYIEMPLDYILPELLKNAARATVESNHNVVEDKLPPINVAIASNKTDFIIRFVE